MAKAKPIRFKCPSCGHEDALPEQFKDGGRFTCPNCYAQLNTYKEGNKRIFHCALGTKEAKECESDIERPLPKPKKHGFLDITVEAD